MARFYGEIGFAVTVETTPGISEDTIVEKKFYGRVLRTSVRSSGEDAINPDPVMSNSIDLVVNKFAFANLTNIRYIRFEGELWKVSSLEVQKPHLIVGMGEVYNGPVANPSVA